ncbi:MAG: hybrid sensor histidine kinase/response regulator [Candidatus Aminicenantia bacterium]
MNLSKKYLLGTSILFSFILTIAIAFFATVSYLNSIHFNLYRENTTSLTILYWIVRDFYNLRILTYKHIGAETIDEMETFRNQSDLINRRIMDNLEKLRLYLKDSSHINLYENFRKEFSKFNNERTEELRLSDSFLKRDAFEHANSAGFESFETAGFSIRKLIEEIEKDAERSYLSFRNITQKISLLVAIFSIFLVALFFIYYRVFSAHIIHPVENLSRLIKKITEKKDWGKRVHLERKDEIGTLISSFNELSLAIQSTTEEIGRKNIKLKEYSEGLEKLVEEKTKELKESSIKYYELWRTLNEVLKISPDAIITTDNDLKINGWNPSAEKMFGYTEENIKGKSIKILMEKEEIRNVEDAISSPEFKSFYRLDSTMLNKEGKRIPCDFFLSPLFNQEKKEIGYVAIVRDLSERKLLEHEIIHAKKMESVGALSAGIAHDFNNILSAILGYASFMKSFFNEKDRFYRYIETIETSSRRGINLTENLLNLYKPSPAKLEPLNLNEMVNEITFFLEKSFENVIIEKNLEPNLSLTEGDHSQIYNAILNIITNAEEAMMGRGKISIRTGEIIKDIPQVKKYVFFSVKDTGPGIPEEIIGKIFEPFFTTKGERKGTGLGLTIVSNIVKKHNGFIEVKSESGNGAEFILYFPAIDKKEIKEEEVEERLVRSVKEATVLAIEDEEDIRELLKDCLLSFGMVPLIAKNGIDGLKIFKEKIDEIALVILDIHMPGMSGFEVQKELRKLKEDIKILWVSGLYREGKIPLDRNSAFLPKPFSIDTLMRKIQKLLSN